MKTVRRITAPVLPVLTLEEAYLQLRLDAVGSPPSHPEDLLIAAEIKAITADLDAGTGWLGRALAPQTWQVGFTAFPSSDCGVLLPYPPFIEIVSFEYTDSDGVTQTLFEGTDFRVIPGTEEFPRALVRPVFDGSWPVDARNDYDAIRIIYRCGYASGSPEVADVPEQVKNVIRSVLTETYDTRGVYDNSAILRGQVLERVMNTLTNIRVYNNS